YTSKDASKQLLLLAVLSSHLLSNQIKLGKVPVMDTNQFNLKWTDHGQSVMKWIDYFAVSGKFTDVSLVAEGKLINVHRNILAACSPMLE
ncbi:hypothetical protein QYM36_005503, partial [Artemia franciscana]